MSQRPYRVLFLCTGNSARSLIAECLLRRWGGERFESYSAGSQPRPAPHPLALETLRLFSLAESLGGVESLACHPATMTHVPLGEEGRRAAGIGDGLVRLSAGIEGTEDLLADVRQGLAAAGC